MGLRVDVGWACAALLAAGCELSRPEGHFDPEYPDATTDSDGDFDVDAAGLDFDAGVGFFDTPDGSEAGVVIEPPSDARYTELVGAYFARIDDYSSASSEVSFIGVPLEIRVRNRTSYFVAALLAERNGGLVWSERVCRVTHAQVCETGCVSSGTTTKVHPQVDPLYATAKPTDRAVTLDESGAGKLVAEAHALYLGFDASEDPGLPANDSDGRVWDPVSGGGLEGLYTEGTVEVKPLVGPTQKAGCRLSLAQRLQSAWSATLSKSGESFVLHGSSGNGVDLGGTETKLLAATATGAAKPADCMNQDGATSTQGERVISFAKVSLDQIADCPTVPAFEAQLSADPP